MNSSTANTRTGRQLASRFDNLRLSTGLKALLDDCYELRYGRGLSTVRLLTAVDTEKEKLVCSIVALLDLEPVKLRRLLSGEQWQFVAACHDYLRHRHQSRPKY